ncbi:MAG: hypothetical protein KA998_00605 [Rickettsiaceae bacterium]|nr:hypothetical protein [Rickettsiaceae bacterium]
MSLTDFFEQAIEAHEKGKRPCEKTFSLDKYITFLCSETQSVMTIEQYPFTALPSNPNSNPNSNDLVVKAFCFHPIDNGNYHDWFNQNMKEIAALGKFLLGDLGEN